MGKLKVHDDSNLRTLQNTLNTLNNLSYFGPQTSWHKVAAKSGGARDAGERGGIYKTNNGKKALIKKDAKIEFNISEFLGSQFFQAISPEYGAEVSLTVPKGEKIKKDGSNVYVRSEFVENYNDDLYVHMDKNLSSEDRYSTFFRKDGRPLFVGTREVLSHTLEKAFSRFDYEGLGKVLAGSALIGDDDVHIGNIGVVRKDAYTNPKLVRIDFGWAFSKLQEEIHPHAKTKHLPGKGPTNHLTEFPRALKLNDKFVEALFDAAKIPLNGIIDNSFTELQKYYSKEALIKWAKHAMPAKFKDKSFIKLDEIILEFKDIMSKRQSSLKEFGIQIKLGLLIKKEDDGVCKVVDPKAFSELVTSNEKYFKDIIDGNRKLKLRDKKLNDVNDFLKEAINYVINNTQNLGKTDLYKVVRKRGNDESISVKKLYEDMKAFNEKNIDPSKQQSFSRVIKIIEKFDPTAAVFEAAKGTQGSFGLLYKVPEYGYKDYLAGQLPIEDLE